MLPILSEIAMMSNICICSPQPLFLCSAKSRSKLRRSRHSRHLHITAARQARTAQDQIILPGEDQDPLRWVESAREAALDADVGSGQKRRFRRHVQEASEDPTDAKGSEMKQSEELISRPLRRLPSQQTAVRAFGADKVLKFLQREKGFEAVLDACELIWPEWADNGCRLLDLQGAGAVPGPTVPEAAAALNVASEVMLHSMSGGERMLKGRDRRITGLIEALRLLPPRPPPGVEDEDLNSQHSSYAQNSEQAEPMPSVVPSATAFSDAIAAAAPLAADSSCGSTSEKQDTGPTNNPSHGTAQSDKSAGGKRSKGYHPVATTQALFAMGVIGGPLLFEEEMTALLERSVLRYQEHQGKPIWRPRRIADMLWALGLSHHWTPRLAEIETLLVSGGGIAACTPREAVSSLWAFATLGYAPNDLMRTVEEKGWSFTCQRPLPNHPPRGLEALTAKQLASLVWSLTAAGMVQSKPFTDVWEELGRRGLEKMKGSAKSLMQVHQAAIAVKLETKDRLVDMPRAMHDLLLGAQLQWSETIKPEHAHNESLYEGQVASALVGLGRFHVREDHSSGYAVDLSLPEHRIAIEVDGPSHMARNHYERLLGHTSLKRRHLEGLGWKVVSVPFFEWDELVGPHEKQSYLRDRLQAAGVQ